MDLIERYLAAIRRNLPADKATDVTAELREDLFSRIEEREGVLGRTLDKIELSGVIKDTGHPLVVASRYRQQQQLIGPETYPFFIFTLKLVLLIVGVALFPVFFWIERSVAKKPLISFEALGTDVSFVLACMACGWASFGMSCLVVCSSSIFSPRNTRDPR